MQLTTEALLSKEDGRIYDADIVLDSVNSKGVRLITIKLSMWRPILAEFNTHRMLSKNAPSSRALSVTSLLKKIEHIPTLPVWWGKRDGPGMQAFEELNDADITRAKKIWQDTKEFCINSARQLYDLGLHQQVSNRIVESWMTTTVVATGTQWDNLFRQRIHIAAQPEFHILASRARTAIENSIPYYVEDGEWHVPFISDKERNVLQQNVQLNVSAARCARASYFQYDGTYNVDKDIDLFNRLWCAEPPHASPFEHVAQSTGDRAWYANFRGWMQMRKNMINENVLDNFYDGPVRVRP